MKFTLALITLLFSLPCNAQTPLSAKTQQRIDSLFREYAHPNTPGYAIGVVKGRQTLYTKGYGSANLDYELPITAQSSFDIASVSKQFTAACVALLILDGKLRLDDPVSMYVPALSKYKDTIRIEHLIYNTSGIIDYFKLPRPGGLSWITFNYFDIDYCIKVSLTPDTLAFHPGDKWDYCNTNYMLLTKIVEKVSGQSFTSFSQQRLFTPLHMQHTLINDDITAVIPNRVTPYNPRSTLYVDAYRKEGIHVNSEGVWIQHPRNSPHYGGSGVATTVNDLILWEKNFFSPAFGGKPFYDLMHKTMKFKHDRDNQAFGLYFGDFHGKTYVAWDGGDYGISSQVIRFPESQVAIVVLSNLGNGEAYKKAEAIAAILMADKIL